MTWQSWGINIMWTLANTVAILTLCEMLDLKLKKRFPVMLYCICTMLLNAVRTYLLINMPYLPVDIVFLGFVVPASAFLLLRLVSTDKSLKIILYIILVYSVGLLGHNLAYFILYIWFPAIISIDFISSEAFYISLIVKPTVVLFYCIFLFVWKRHIGYIRAEIPSIWVFLLITGGQMSYAMSQTIAIMSDQLTNISAMTVSGVLLLNIGNIAILQVVLTNSKKKETEDQLTQLHRVRELEQTHYESLLERRQALLKIRHDFNNQLVTAHRLIESGNSKQATLLLKGLEQSISLAEETEFCKNAIVNAVLLEKQKDCSEADIKIDAKISIAEQCTIEPIHLCSIFTNLLDNAISAVTPLTAEKRVITLRTVLKGDYLHIRCVNPVSDFTKSEKKERPGKGYGKIILADIANLYSGNFTAERRGDEHIAVVSVLGNFAS